MLQLLNFSGFNGMTYEDPIPFGGIEVRFQGWPDGISETCEELSPPAALAAAARTASTVQSGQDAKATAEWRLEDGAAVLVIPNLASYAAFHLK
ncbi:hypothetical protein D3C80_1909450 [compost metagenome]